MIHDASESQRVPSAAGLSRRGFMGRWPRRGRRRRNDAARRASPARPGGRIEAAGETRDPAVARRRREPARNVRSQAGTTDGRTVPLDPDHRAGRADFGTDAADGTAAAAHGDRSLAEHRERRPRRRRATDASRTTRRADREVSRPRRDHRPRTGPADSQVPDYVSFYTATRGTRQRGGTGRFSRRPLQPHVPDHRLAPPNLRRLASISATRSSGTGRICGRR